MRRKNFCRAVLLFCCCLCLTQASMALAPIHRIKFKPGHTSAKAKGHLRGMSDKVEYVVRVRAGQSLRAEAHGAGHLDVSMLSPSGQSGEKDMQSWHTGAEPTEAGDYRITVRESPKGEPWRGKFTLTVTAN